MVYCLIIIFFLHFIEQSVLDQDFNFIVKLQNSTNYDQMTTRPHDFGGGQVSWLTLNVNVTSLGADIPWP